ncbi:MAG: DUF5060 domain-containing protein [Lentisphaerae bacterium]|nr:MAG: DUF5060 domain-containing protein [Lentisphaerota bacterium]
MIHTNTATVPCWDVYEITIPGNGSYTGKGVWARFINGSREVKVRGFYDGEKTWKIRFMPDQLGRWYWEAWSANQWLQAGSGEFECVPPVEGNHGPVQVWQRYHFRYADGTPYYPIGTTCYAWIHQDRELQEETLNTLAKSPFNKLRMCVFPKWYEYCRVEPELYPFAGEPPRNWNFNEFNPAFFRHLENAIVRLAALGIEADVILFHPYDHWGFANMGEQEDLNYLRYVVRRLAAFRNVWWSKGGRLHGRSPARIAFLRQIMEEGPGYGWEPIGADWARCRGCKKSNDRLLFYFGRHEAPPKFTFQLGEATHLRAELLDVWAMTRQPLDGEFCGEVTLELPTKPFQAILFHP